MPSLRRPWAWALGATTTLVVVSACQLIAGIDEKIAASDQGGAADGGDAAPSGDAGSDAPPPECTRHTDCVAAHGDNWVCVKPDGKCQPLLTNDCQVVHAAAIGAPPAQKIEVLTDDNTIFLGFVMDLLGSGKSAGIARSQAVELAVSEIHTVTKGIPGGPGGTRRPIAVVVCSETKDATSAPDPKVPARHLVEDLHVPAIIGASNSDTSLDLFNGYAFSRGTLVFSPNALSSALSSPSDNGLFWRTSATSILQGHAIQQEIGLASDDLHAQFSLGNIKLAMVYIGDAFGTDMFPFIETGLVFNGAPLNAAPNGATCSAPPCASDQLVLVETYPATAQNDVFQKIGNDIAAFGAHIVVLVGRKDSVQIAKAVEDNLADAGGAFRPTYIFTQGSATSDVTTILTPNPDLDGVRGRVRGTLPLPSPDELTVFDPLYNTAFPAGPPPGNGVPGSYDIAYLLTYAALAAGDATSPLTGARMNDGLKKVVDPNAAPAYVFKTGTPDLGRAMDAIIGGQRIKVKGFSYTFDFDPNLGEVPGKVELWCVGSPANALVPSPWIWDPFVDGGATTLADGGPLPEPPGFTCPPAN